MAAKIDKHAQADKTGVFPREIPPARARVRLSWRAKCSNGSEKTISGVQWIRIEGRD